MIDFLQITGIIILSVGLTVQGIYHGYADFLDAQFFTLPTFLIVIGSIIFFIAFFGCFGAMKENYCLIITVRRAFDSRTNDLDLNLISVLRASERNFHSRAVGRHHRLHPQELDLLADHVGAQADDGRLHKSQQVEHCDR